MGHPFCLFRIETLVVTVLKWYGQTLVNIIYQPEATDYRLGVASDGEYFYMMGNVSQVTESALMH